MFGKDFFLASPPKTLEIQLIRVVSFDITLSNDIGSIKCWPNLITNPHRKFQLTQKHAIIPQNSLIFIIIGLWFPWIWHQTVFLYVPDHKYATFIWCQPDNCPMLRTASLCIENFECSINFEDNSYWLILWRKYQTLKKKN